MAKETYEPENIPLIGILIGLITAFIEMPLSGVDK